MTHVDPALVMAVGHALHFCLVCGLALSAAWGTWLMVAPRDAARFAANADRWVSTDHWSERLNRKISSYRIFYRYHRTAGVLITAGAAYSLIRWFTAYDRAALLANLDPRILQSGLDWLVSAAEWSFVAFNAVILIAGVVVLVRPSLLKAPERFTDRWVKVDAGNMLDRRYDPLAALVADYPRLVGAMVVLSCSFLLWRVRLV